jgi:excisionase family DNA binding protein
MHGYASNTLIDSLPDRHFLTAAEIAPFLRVDERTVRRMAERWHDSGGQEGLPAVKIGRQWRFEKSTVCRHLTSQGIHTPPHQDELNLSQRRSLRT